MSTTLHIAYLASGPLASSSGQNWDPIHTLDFEEERKILQDSFDEACKAINVRFEHATHDTLRTLTTLGCRMLHYSGHGMRYVSIHDTVGEFITRASQKE